ncbi:hypothetical protein D9611_001950 [Ephemerocybe angulata]|uniref:DUF202 domain-containing protein n=1 Tax=Ephemerocybe angulata TaxID=980116 RepID=A0A8H5FMA7_9AGAR|nr:hypothetical protein D9611_001950 [Tulosesus angulatus]
MTSTSNGTAPSEPTTPITPHPHRSSLFERSWQAVLSPFSPSALASLPRVRRPQRYFRADDIPETSEGTDGQRPTVRDYHAITSVPPQVRVPKKVQTSVKVEGKVWFANERTWVSWLNQAMVLAALSVALFNASKDEIARRFAIVYAVISIATLLYGYAIYQHRITMIRRRDPGHFDALAGPILLSIALFFAVLANFIIRGTPPLLASPSHVRH